MLRIKGLLPDERLHGTLCNRDAVGAAALSPDWSMHLDSAQITLTGDRHENQDRTEILVADDTVLAMVADGMGGHANGDIAAETAIATLARSFRRSPPPYDQPARFLREALKAAHRAVAALGENMRIENRPGTTAVCALISGDQLWWTNVGDSRAYHVRGNRILARTVDHTVIEGLVASGEITREQAQLHPERHVIEYCLGIDEDAPPVQVGQARLLMNEDLILLCSDGLWSQLGEALIVDRLGADEPLERIVAELADDAVQAAHPQSDNVAAVVLRAVADAEDPS